MSAATMAEEATTMVTTGRRPGPRGWPQQAVGSPSLPPAAAPEPRGLRGSAGAPARPTGRGRTPAAEDGRSVTSCVPPVRVGSAVDEGAVVEVGGGEDLPFLDVLV